MPRTLTQVDNDLAALEARVNAIDGQNLADPSLSVLTVLAAKDTALQTTMRQSILMLEQALNQIKADLATLRATVNTHLGT